ncbi:MAG: helix-turn-helix domain-containing protein [Parabacteroides merdae]
MGYYVTFQGDYFEKLLNGIINRANPIFHIGMNDQIVKHFGEMLDCARAQIQVPGCFGGSTMHTIGSLFDQQKSGLWISFYAEDTGSMRIDAGKHLRQVYTGRYRRIHQHELIPISGNHSSNTLGSLPISYMLQLKLSKIKDLLSSTEMSIQDIAMKLNFESADYFSYFFRSKTGINPLSYRKEIEKQREKPRRTSHTKRSPQSETPSKLMP